ncbi:hypothetical protein XANCAGTX0491_000254 [Xanthoria calcicola]
MLLSSLATILAYISFGLAHPAGAPSITNSGSGFPVGVAAANGGDFLKRPSPRIAPPEGSLSARPPAPFLWRPDPEAFVFINFTSYARPITWFTGIYLLYVHNVREDYRIFSKLPPRRISNTAKLYVLDRMQHGSPQDRIVCGGGFVWNFAGVTLSVYMVPDALCYNLGLYLNGIQLYANSYSFVEAEMQLLVSDSTRTRYRVRGVAQLNIE